MGFPTPVEAQSNSDKLQQKDIRKINKNMVTEKELFGSISIRKKNKSVTEEELFGKQNVQKQMSKEKPKIFTENPLSYIGKTKLNDKQSQKSKREKDDSLNENEVFGSNTSLKKIKVNSKDLFGQQEKNTNIQMVTEQELFGVSSNELKNSNKTVSNTKVVNKNKKVDDNSNESPHKIVRNSQLVTEEELFGVPSKELEKGSKNYKLNKNGKQNFISTKNP